MSEKVTAYDATYSHNNPFENITAQILLDNIGKIDIDLTKQNIKKETSVISNIFDSCYNFFFKKNCNFHEFEILRLLDAQANAITYKDWYDASIQLDILQDKDTWKDDPVSEFYDYKMVQKQIEELKNCRMNEDYEKLLYIIRTCWKRDFAGINNEKLYGFAHVGTKRLISDYIEECVKCLDFLASENCELADEYILDVLLESKRNYGRAGITMSGGGTFGLVGIGVFSTLLEMDLFPKIVSGSSCGSIVSAIMCSKTSDEIKAIFSSLFDKTFEVFNIETDHDTMYTHLSRLLKYGIWFDSKYLQHTMKQFLGNITFKEAFNKTGRILNITVSSATIHDQPSLLNYLTAPNVLIWSAVCASCSLPVVFASSTIYEKNSVTGKINEWSNPMLKFVDGSLNSDLPISRLSEMFNVNHTIACQVNPHIVPFVKFSSELENELSEGSVWSLNKMIYQAASIISLEISHYCEVLNEMGVMVNLATKIKQLISQSYTGDITILPEIKFGEQFKTLENPTPTFIWGCILKGARATWPKLSIIKDQYSVEFAMDKYISILKSRVVFDTSKSFESLNNISVSCESSPQKGNYVGEPKNCKSVANGSKECRKRGETITLSEKIGHTHNSFNSALDNNTNNKTKSKSLRRKKNNRANILKPEHSFESLRKIPKGYNFNHPRSLSYTQSNDNKTSLIDFGNDGKEIIVKHNMIVNDMLNHENLYPNEATNMKTTKKN